MEQGVRLPRRKSRLPPHLHSVMGNANLRLARGDTGAAIELCMEVIRQGTSMRIILIHLPCPICLGCLQVVFAIAYIR